MKGLNNGGRSGARWDLSPMPTPRPMPILPRSAVASSDFRPYCSVTPSSNLNVVLEPANPKASRPPLKQSNSVLDNNTELLTAVEGNGNATTARGGSLKQSPFKQAPA